MALSGSSFDTTLVNNSPAQFGGMLSPNLSVVATSPDSSTVLTTSPTDLFVTFDRPIDDFSLSNFDFTLVHVAADGSTTPLGTGEASYSEALDPNDPTGSRIDLTLTNPLLPGSYGLLLNADSQIQGLDGSSLASNRSDSLLSTFTVDQPKFSHVILTGGGTETGLAGAVDLGTIGSTETVHSDVLNLASDPGQVLYYKINVAPGHHWRLGVAITTEHTSNSLASALSLFDSEGRLISTNNAGLPGDINDPYLFAGLAPGTYYVGVSAQKNVPDASGAYDPSGSTLGTSQAGGPFQLHLVAEDADQPTRVLGVRVDHADPLSTNPTGLTLQFSGPIAVTGLQDPNNPGLTLVDQDGRSWPITFVKYDATLGQLSLLFNQTLASGTYSLHVSSTDGLADLGGLHPIGTGLYPTTLASLTVVQQGPIAGDLGPILPGVASSGLDAEIEVNPGRATVEQFVVVEPGVYAFGGLTGTSNVNYSITDDAGNILASGPGSSTGVAENVSLSDGVYHLVLTTTASTPVTVDLAIVQKNTQLSSLLDAGVAQGPALNLRLVTPQANFGQVSNDPNPPTNPTATTLNQQPTAGAPEDRSTVGSDSSGLARSLGATVSVGLNIPAGPSASGLLLYAAGPVGRPSSQSNQISAVGPSGPSGLVAIASASAVPPRGLSDVPDEIDGGGQLEPDAPPLAPEVNADPAPSLRGGSISTESGLLARSPGSRRADDRILEQADWIGQLVSNATGWLGTLNLDRAGSVEEAPANVPVHPPTFGAPDAEEPQLETASFSSPIVVGGVLATIAYRYRRTILAYFRVRPQPASQARSRSILVGPHRRARIRVR